MTDTSAGDLGSSPAPTGAPRWRPKNQGEASYPSDDEPIYSGPGSAAWRNYQQGTGRAEQQHEWGYQQQHTGAPSGYYGMLPPAEPRNGYGIAALICGVVGIFAGIIPILFAASGSFGLAGIILALVNLNGRIRRRVATNKRMTIVALVLSVLAFVLGILGIVIVISATDKLSHDLNNLPTSYPTS